MANLALTVVAFAAFFAIVTSFATSWLDGTGRVAEGFRVARVTDAAVGRASLKENTRCVNPMGTSTTFRIANDGQSDLRNFSQWTLSAKYLSATGTTVQTLTYVSSGPLSENQWTVGDIVLPNGSSEVFQRGIIDPGEEATVSIRVNPGIWASSANSIALTTDTGRTASISLTGENQCGYYLHNNPTPPTGATNQQANLPADNTYPSQTTLYNYDQDQDASAGRLIVKGASSSTESDLTKYQNWRTAALGKDLALSGTVRVKLWGAVKNFDTVKTGSVTVYLRDYNPSGGTYTEIANATLTATPWDTAATGTWVEKTIPVTGVNYTVAAGRQLEIKLIVLTGSGDDMWFAYDTVSYPAFVEIPVVKTLTLHSESRYVADAQYNQLRETAHEGGYYLHDNPTPPTAATSSQANLTITQVYPSAPTLYNYDQDNDAVAGRRIVKGGTGATESDLTKYQNWRTAALAEDKRIQGVVKLDFWSMVGSFSTTATGTVTAYLRDYNSSGGSYTEIANATLTAGPWDASASGTWVQRFIEISVSDYTLVRGRQLELKLIVGATSTSDMHFAYDVSSYASVLVLPGTRETDPSGNPATVTIQSGSGTGRVPAPTNSGRWVMPLDGYSRVSDSVWNMTYRVSRKAEGWIWRKNAADVSTTSTQAWVNVDLSAHLPAGATGAVVEIVNTGGSSYGAVVRGGGDTRNYVPTGTEQKLRTLQHRWQVVRVGSDGKIQAWVENTAVQLKILGYTYGDDPSFWATPPDITPGTTGSWTTVDVSALVDSDATGVILFIDAISASEALGQGVQYGVREVGSTFDPTGRQLNGSGNTMYLVGLDVNKRFEAWVPSPDPVDPLGKLKIYLVGQTKSSVVFRVNDTAVADPSTGSWQPVDADTYSVPSDATGVVLAVHNNSNQSRDAGFRHGDSTDDWAKTVWRDGHLQAAVGLNAANEWDEYLGSTVLDISIAAFTKGIDPADADLHADMDVVIRKANGEVRATLGTDVASTSDVIDPFWHTKTATFSVPEYLVVDQTDYLDIGLFAHVTRNDRPAAAVLLVRIDDGTLPDSDRTRASVVALTRE